MYCNKFLCMDDKRIAKGLLKNKIKKTCIENVQHKHRTKEAESKSKRYKDRLTSIIRVVKNEYYNNVLWTTQNNIGGIWNMLNRITNNKNQISYPQYFINNNQRIVI